MTQCFGCVTCCNTSCTAPVHGRTVHDMDNTWRHQSIFAHSEFGTCDVVIPQPRMDLTTRRVLTMDWVGGVKLTSLPPEEVRELIKVGQEAFLTQLLVVGFIHGDPHGGTCCVCFFPCLFSQSSPCVCALLSYMQQPMRQRFMPTMYPGNLLKVTEGPDAGKLALLDFGLVAEIPATDREAMVSATIHLANRDWNSLVDDFVRRCLVFIY